MYHLYVVYIVNTLLPFFAGVVVVGGGEGCFFCSFRFVLFCFCSCLFLFSASFCLVCLVLFVNCFV